VLETTEQTKREEAYGVRRGEAQWVKEAERARSSSRTDKRKGLRGGANMGKLEVWFLVGERAVNDPASRTANRVCVSRSLDS
jgi:hypothetical protein